MQSDFKNPDRAKKFFLILFLLTSTFSNYLFAQTSSGNVSGLVKDSIGKPVEFATVFIKGSNKSVHTNSNGEYTLNNVPEGEAIIVVRLQGFSPIEKAVLVKANETTSLPEIVLAEDMREVKEVVISSRKVNTFADKETDYVARMPLSNIENPQVYSVVTNELMKEQIAVDPKDAMRNATGAAITVYPAGGFGITSRGFNTGINARNGMETSASRSSIDIGNVERIEVLKGPSGTLFGASVSSYGGVVNLVTKKPFATTKTEISYTTGSFGLHRLTADVNTPLNPGKTALFRVNAVVNQQKSFLDYGFNNTFMIAPSLSYKATEKLMFHLDAELFNTNNTRIMYHRVTAASGIDSPDDIQLSYRQSLYNDDADAKTSASKFFAEARYKLSSKWTSSTLFSFVGENVERSYQYYPTWISPTVAARSVSIYGPIYNNYTNVQQNFTGEFKTGFIRHRLLLGTNYRFYDTKFNYSPTGFIDTVDVSTAFKALDKKTIDTYAVNTPFPSPDEHTLSVYGTDVINFGSRLSTLLSLRVDHYKRMSIGTTKGFEQTSLAPKLGIVYQVVKEQVSVFANYMSGFQNVAPVNQPDGSRFIVNPIYANQSEAGIKMETFDKKLSMTVSYYQIAIDNATRVNADLFTVQDGKQLSKGTEIEVIANPFAGFNILSGWAINDNRIVKTTDEKIEGNKASGAPENVVNVWASYTLQGTRLKGLGIGAGGNFVDKAYLSTANTYYLPSYSVFNYTVFYDQPKWRIGVKANNVTNERYWDLYGSPQAPENYAVNLTVRF